MNDFVITGSVPSWPDDADGDMLRALYDEQFDFTREHDIGFIVDTEAWPPSEALLAFLESEYGDLELAEPDPETDEAGYVIAFIKHKIDYDFVVRTQSQLTERLQPFAAWCDSWTVDLG